MVADIDGAIDGNHRQSRQTVQAVRTVGTPRECHPPPSEMADVKRGAGTRSLVFSRCGYCEELIRSASGGVLEWPLSLKPRCDSSLNAPGSFLLAPHSVPAKRGTSNRHEFAKV